MSEGVKSSRRSFLAGAAAGPVVPLLAASKAPVNHKPVGAEIRRRADHYVGQRYLVVDYYRIRRKLAFPLPVRDLSVRDLVVPGIGSEYPWATWMTWELEERVNALGYCAEWFNDKRASALATRDLEALAAWPAYRQYDQPDLSSGHSGRLLWTAYAKWSWPAAGTREKIRAACDRHAEDVLPYSRMHYGQVTRAQDILALPAPHSKLANIPLIGTIGAALTANVAGHPAGPELNRLVAAVYLAILELRSKGYTEAVGYDGYVLDFLADWLETLPAADRTPILDHPNFRQLLEQSYMLGAPGAPAEVAQLSDVEAREMSFHFSGQAKVAAMQPDPVRWWFLASWPLSWMRANALGAIAGLPDKPRMTDPPAGALDAHYAAVLRSGWQRDDLAVIASCHNSPTGHLQVDNGTLVIGHRGRWILSDPGYQQYAAGAERVFTVGPAAHNYPVINGVNQTVKAAQRPTLDTVGPGLFRARLDLTACYPASAGLKSVVRMVWLAGRNFVVVADDISGEHVSSVGYSWHGHPDAAWYTRENWVLLHVPDADLWFHSPHAAITDRNIEREEGSRGQLIAAAQVNPAPRVIWWVFALGDNPPAVRLSSDGGSLRVSDREFRSAS
jgi:hypothetical protein